MTGLFVRLQQSLLSFYIRALRALAASRFLRHDRVSNGL